MMMLSSAAPSLSRGTILRPSSGRIVRQNSQVEIVTSPTSPTRHLALSPRTARSRQLRSCTTQAALPLSSLSMAATALPSPAALWTLAAFLGGGLIGFLAWFDSRRKSSVPVLQSTPTPFNEAVLARCPSLYSMYQPLPFLTNRHVETIFAARTRTSPGLQYRRECVIMSDGGCVALDYDLSDDAKALPKDAPLLILFPGLTGGSGDSYVQYAVQSAKRAGIRAVVFNSRGTADSPILTPQFYSASFTGDTKHVIHHLQEGHPNSLLLAAGWSLGANILLRYLGEEGASTPIAAAVSMCNPFDLTISNANFTKGFNTIYDKNLSDGLKKIFAKHQMVWNGAKGPARPDLVLPSKTIRAFDDAITRHTFGWPSVDAYYAGSCSSLSVPNITIPFLCLQALDDPIAPEEAIPYAALKANPNATFVGTPCGGHLGWIAGPGAPFGEPWSDRAMLEWLVSVIAQLKSNDEEQEGILIPTVETSRELVAAASDAQASSSPRYVSAPAMGSPTSLSNARYASLTSSPGYQPPTVVPSPAAASLNQQTLFLNASPPGTATPHFNHNVAPELSSVSKPNSPTLVPRLRCDLVPSYDQMMEQQQQQQQQQQQVSTSTTARLHLSEIEEQRPVDDQPAEGFAGGSPWSSSTPTPVNRLSSASGMSVGMINSAPVNRPPSVSGMSVGMINSAPVNLPPPASGMSVGMINSARNAIGSMFASGGGREALGPASVAPPRSVTMGGTTSTTVAPTNQLPPTRRGAPVIAQIDDIRFM